MSMNNTAHTPGPWFIHKYNTERATDLVGIYGKEDPDTTKARADLIVEGIWGNSYEQCDANTRLIAAAPELLEAAKAFDRFAAQRRELLGELSDEMERVVALHRAAIAKAIGG